MLSLIFSFQTLNKYLLSTGVHYQLHLKYFGQNVLYQSIISVFFMYNILTITFFARLHDTSDIVHVHVLRYDTLSYVHAHHNLYSVPAILQYIVQTAAVRLPQTILQASILIRISNLFVQELHSLIDNNILLN